MHNDSLHLLLDNNPIIQFNVKITACCLIRIRKKKTPHSLKHIRNKKTIELRNDTRDEKLFLLKKKQFVYFHHMETAEHIKIKCFKF